MVRFSAAWAAVFRAPPSAEDGRTRDVANRRSSFIPAGLCGRNNAEGGEGEGYVEKDRTDTFAGLTASVCHGMLVRCPFYSASA